MPIRAYYWHENIEAWYKLLARKALRRSPQRFFRVGNAGDIFARMIIEKEWNAEALRVKEDGKRLLLIGSIAHLFQPGDVLSGVGVKFSDIPRPAGRFCFIHALRGPISYDCFSKAGYDVSNVQFLLDPGLLIRFYAEGLAHKRPQGVIFIPHFRERNLYYRSKLPKGMRLVDIDNQPMKIAKQILEAELVYSSSLHGVIFSHALNRPVVLVQPQTAEPILKYKDYFCSVSLEMPKPISSVLEASRHSKPVSPANVKYVYSDFKMPSKELLLKFGVWE